MEVRNELSLRGQTGLRNCFFHVSSHSPVEVSQQLTYMMIKRPARSLAALIVFQGPMLNDPFHGHW